MKSPCCKHEIVIQTDPQNCEYVITSGAQKKVEEYEAEDAETMELTAEQGWFLLPSSTILFSIDLSIAVCISTLVISSILTCFGIITFAEKGKLADPFYRLEHQEVDLQKKKAAEPLLVRLQRVSDARHADDYSLNKALRAQLRVRSKFAIFCSVCNPIFRILLSHFVLIYQRHRKRVAEEETASRKLGLGIRLLPKSEEDIKAASNVKFKSKFDKNRKDKRALIHASSIFPESSYSSSKKRMELEAKRRKISAASASSLLRGGFKASSLSTNPSASKPKVSSVSVRKL